MKRRLEVKNQPRSIRKPIPDLKPIPEPPGIADLKANGRVEANATCYQMGGCRVICGSSGRGWHLSISHPTRYPTWDEIAEARYRLVPDHALMVMLLPTQEEYVNLHPNTFQLWEAKYMDFKLLVPGEERADGADG